MAVSISSYTKKDKNLIASENRMLMLVDIEMPCIAYSASEQVWLELARQILKKSTNMYINGNHELPVGTMFIFEDNGVLESTFHQVTYSHYTSELGWTMIEFTNTYVPANPFENYAAATTRIFVLTNDTSSTTSYNIYLVKDNDNFSWNGKTWYAVDFDIDEILETSKGDVPKLDLRISNINRLMEYYLQQYDFFLKTHSYKPIFATIYVVNSYFSGGSTYELKFKFELKQPKTNDKMATFSLGATSPYTHRFPYCRMYKNQCRVKQFGDIECGHTIGTDEYGNPEVCDRQLKTCKNFGNETRYGGFPTMGKIGLKI